MKEWTLRVLKKLKAFEQGDFMVQGWWRWMGLVGWLVG